MKILLLLSFLAAYVPTGYAITCTKCTESTSDDPWFPLRVDFNEMTCSRNPGEMVCDEAVTSCWTTIITMHFRRGAGPLALTEMDRDCGPPLDIDLPSGGACSGEGLAEAIASRMDPSEMFPEALGLTYENLDASVCFCDSSDRCTPPSAATDEQSITAIRLVDGGSDLEGRVEIELDGEWGTICDDSWDLDDATVVCRMLGFDGASGAPGSAQFGEGSGPILLDDVLCTGDEATLTVCPHPPFKQHNCGHTEDAGVICFTTGTTRETPTPAGFLVDVRLVGGNVPSRGRVEVSNSYGQWGTICDPNWTQADANVVCGILGYDGALSYSNNAEYVQSSGRIMLEHVLCSGWESKIASCETQDYSGWGCDHPQEVGVECNVPEPSEFQIRLVGGSHPWEGRVEVLNQHEWGTICSVYWGKPDGDVACRMLGFSSAYEAISPTDAAYPMPFGEGTGSILLSDLLCTGTEENLADCSHSRWGIQHCSHYEDAGLVCNSPDPDSVVVRLVNGRSKAEGRVEVLYEGEFGTVCDDSWDVNDAAVVCRMLGYEGASEAPGLARFGQGSGDIVLDDVVCQGSEDNIASCAHRAWGENNCGHVEDASAICTGELNLPVRLMNGNNANDGRVEIFRYGAWGSVCDDFWDINDGHVVCRMLGYERASRIWWGATYGTGTGRILLDNVECNGNEATLDDCDHPPWGVHDCNHYEDAGVVCV
ncbi:deleted in malignant brain tumors 1 protein [Strongylocentrotus purpuratus]|uniref:SRCR domain-containing protein n=1 Tax=Strongylocentrotus purpuratus TaxID=7668 RepID=A0A7M7NAW0_STRPU|nr:deleted in malignant brain tumors 1 protein [Strongylocentrotus purpuratus]